MHYVPAHDIGGENRVLVRRHVLLLPIVPDTYPASGAHLAQLQLFIFEPEHGLSLVRRKEGALQLKVREEGFQSIGEGAQGGRGSGGCYGRLENGGIEVSVYRVTGT